MTLIFSALFGSLLASAALASNMDFGSAVLAYDRGDYETARNLFAKYARAGDAQAQTYLGLMFLNGDGVQQNDSQAVKWFRAAAERGYAGAQYNLGTMYASGRGVPQDDWETLRWYRMAAEQGLGYAQVKLGLMYRDGNGVPEDLVESYRWLLNAETQGEEGARRFREGLMEKMSDAQLREARIQTWKVVKPSGYIEPPETAAEPSEPETDPIKVLSINEIQSILNVLGYNTGPLDGIPGPRTIAAIKAYQRDHQIEPDGVISQKLMQSLERDISGLATGGGSGEDAESCLVRHC